MIQNKKNSKNYAVIVYENGYPNVGGIAVLIGIYPTNKAAAFISKTVKERNKLSYYPIIELTNNPPTSTFVEDYLEKINTLNELNKAKNLS